MRLQHTGGNTFYSLTEGPKKTKVLSSTSALIGRPQRSPTPASSSRPTLDCSSLGITAITERGGNRANKRASDLDVSFLYTTSILLCASTYTINASFYMSIYYYILHIFLCIYSYTT